MKPETSLETNGADPAENQTRCILLKLNSKERSEPLAIFMLYYAV